MTIGSTIGARDDGGKHRHTLRAFHIRFSRDQATRCRARGEFDFAVEWDEIAHRHEVGYPRLFEGMHGQAYALRGMSEKWELRAS